MIPRLETILVLIFSLPISASSVPQKRIIDRSNSASLELCDLVREPEVYDGKEVRFRSIYLSTLEVSAFVDGRCTDKDHRIWVEFDDEKIRASAKPEIYEKVKAQILCCMLGGLEYFRETKMVVTGIFLSRRALGTGHNGEYSFMVRVTSVHEIAPTKTIKVPGFDPRP